MPTKTTIHSKPCWALSPSRPPTQQKPSSRSSLAARSRARICPTCQSLKERKSLFARILRLCSTNNLQKIIIRSILVVAVTSEHLRSLGRCVPLRWEILRVSAKKGGSSSAGVKGKGGRGGCCVKEQTKRTTSRSLKVAPGLRRIVVSKRRTLKPVPQKIISWNRGKVEVNRKELWQKSRQKSAKTTTPLLKTNIRSKLKQLRHLQWIIAQEIVPCNSLKGKEGRASARFSLEKLRITWIQLN